MGNLHKFTLKQQNVGTNPISMEVIVYMSCIEQQRKIGFLKVNFDGI